MAAPSKTRKATGAKPKQAAKASGTKPRQAAKAPSAKPKQAAKASGTKPRQAAKASSAKPKQTARATGSKPRQAAKASSAKPRQAAAKSTSSKQQTAIYVYGILPADVELTAEMPGVGDPAGPVRVVRSGDLAALVSEIDLAGTLGTPDDLTAHKEILDATAQELPVLPLRFGAVMTSEDAVEEELLEANHDDFADALSELDGRTEYVVKGRYIQDAILGEILSGNKQAAQLRGQISGKDPNATRDARIQLGELINNAVNAQREEDTRVLGNAMEGHCVASVVREPSHELDAAHVAFLVDSDQESDMERVIENLAHDWDGWIEVRLLGPMAAYDFVGAAEPEG